MCARFHVSTTSAVFGKFQRRSCDFCASTQNYQFLHMNRPVSRRLLNVALQEVWLSS